VTTTVFRCGQNNTAPVETGTVLQGLPVQKVGLEFDTACFCLTFTLLCVLPYCRPFLLAVYYALNASSRHFSLLCVSFRSGKGAFLSMAALRREPGRATLLGTLKDMYRKALEMGNSLYRGHVGEPRRGSFTVDF